jgi:trimethylamine:corrinoid methyltransferase-like protein
MGYEKFVLNVDQAPALDEAVDEALKEYMDKRKASIPNSNV